MVTRLETKRLILDNWRPRDAAALFAYAKDPAVGPPAGWKPHESPRESRRIIKTLFRPEGTWKIVYKETGQAIGTIGLSQDRRRPGVKARELGYSMSREYWGQGLMTEAAECVLAYGFERLGLSLISVQTAPDNARSQGVIKKLGFHPEGVERRSFVDYRGEVLDECIYSMLREEWEVRMSSATGE